MAVDRKADHVGNHGGAYVDNDGQTKQFTYIDHDKKIKKSSYAGTAEETQTAKQLSKESNEKRILEVLAMPAVSIAGFNDGMYEHLIVRDKDKGISWHEKAVRETMLTDAQFAYTLSMFVWKRTVREVNWFDDMREDHEAILRGEWKSLM